MQILKQQVSTNVPAFSPCDTSVLCKVFGLLLLLFMHPVHSEKQFNYSIGEKLGHPRSDQPSGDASPCLAQRKPKITTFLNNLSYSSMHTSSKGKNSIYQNLTHGPLIPTPALLSLQGSSATTDAATWARAQGAHPIPVSLMEQGRMQEFRQRTHYRHGQHFKKVMRI